MCGEQQHFEIEVVYISDEERACNQISPTNLQRGLDEFHRNGLVILENAIGLPILQHLRERMLGDIPRNLALPRVHYNHGKEHRNVSQTPPLLAEFMHEEIWVNRFAVRMIEHILGSRPQLSYATSNIALPGGQGRQAVHSDYYCEHLDVPGFLEACIFLDDVCAHNGSTEIWLGTHNGYNKVDHAFSDMGWIKREVFVERSRICGPIQPSIPKSSICIRDLRLWHAGMPNRSSVPRIMLGLLYSPKWFGSHMRLKLPLEARKHVKSWEHVDCLIDTDFAEHHLDYLDCRQELNLMREEQKDLPEYVSKHGTIIAGPEYYL